MNKCCLGCKIRHLNCHSDCKEYQEFLAENERIKERRRRYRELDSSLAYQFKNYLKGIKKWGK